MNKHAEVKPNRLIHEKSPYLLQHAYNPVDWYPWGNEAFEKAKIENKPIFLSIGYSTCHWCHVMEKECFQDPEVANLLNEAFVCVKVDREERPDIDSVYMAICQIMTGTGGWPLTIIMTPDRKPFFATTYVPKTTRFNMIGMLDLVPQIRDAWKTRKQKTREISDQVLMQLEFLQTRAGSASLGKEKIHEAYQLLASNFDERYGGFGTAPKFPTAHNLLFLLRYWKRTKQRLAMRIVEQTLKAMRSGGIYDQAGFGFHRYSVDAQWLVPHFEKMLYDQAMLVMAYVECYQATGNEEYEKTAKEVLEYVTRDMTSQGGGFYSAEDADSEGEEGKFYLWTEDEIRDAMTEDQADLATTVFGVTRKGNFRDAEQAEDGKNILRMVKSPTEIAAEKGISPGEVHDQMNDIVSILRACRDKRVRPAKDDKILTDWNGLMIAAFAKASQVFDDEKYLQTARISADFLLGKMKTANGKLLHRYRLGEASTDGFLEDYAFLVWGLIELYEACFETRYLQSAVDLTDIMLNDFYDKTAGGFYLTGEGSEEMLVRMKQTVDSAIPSGNSVAVLDLLRLARLTADPNYEEYASKIVQAFSKALSDMPEAHTFMMIALDFLYGPSYEVVVTGVPNAEDTRRMLEAIRRQYLPHSVKLFRPIEQETSEAMCCLNHLADYKSIGGRATAYVCRNRLCEQPTDKVDKLLELLGT